MQAANNIVFCDAKFISLQNNARNLKKQNCTKVEMNKKTIHNSKQMIKRQINFCVYFELQKALRVLPAETRKTVYRRARVSKLKHEGRIRKKRESLTILYACFARIIPNRQFKRICFVSSMTIASLTIQCQPRVMQRRSQLVSTS